MPSRYLRLWNMLAVTATFKNGEVLVPNGPLCSSLRPVSESLAKHRRCAEDMPNTVHPCRLAALVEGENDRDPVVNFLKRQAVLWGRQDGTPEDGRVGELGFER